MIVEILGCKYDESLDGILSAIKTRREYLSKLVFHELKAGDTVAFNNRCNPKYLRGVEGTIREKRNSRVVVDLNVPVGRFHRGVVTDTSLIVKVNTLKDAQ